MGLRLEAIDTLGARAESVKLLEMMREGVTAEL